MSLTWNDWLTALKCIDFWWLYLRPRGRQKLVSVVRFRSACACACGCGCASCCCCSWRCCWCCFCSCRGCCSCSFLRFSLGKHCRGVIELETFPACGMIREGLMQNDPPLPPTTLPKATPEGSLMGSYFSQNLSCPSPAIRLCTLEISWFAKNQTVKRL